MMQLQEPAPRLERRGFTLVELIVAIMVLTVGVLGLASTAAVVARQMGGGRSMTIASTVAYSRFERFAALNCAALANGSDTTRNIHERWTVTPEDNSVYRVRDSVWYRTARGTRAHVFESMVECQ